jgi:hypothetical protein
MSLSGQSSLYIIGPTESRAISNQLMCSFEMSKRFLLGDKKWTG